MTGKDVLYIGATLAAGFVAFKVYKAASAAIDAGSSVGAAVVDGAKKVVTEGLNPNSPKNYVYSGLNAVTSTVTDRETNLGGEIWEVVQKVKGWLAPDEKPVAVANDYDAYDFQNVPAPVAAVTYNKERAIQETAQTAFRLSELNAPYETKFDRFLKTIAGQ